MLDPVSETVFETGVIGALEPPPAGANTPMEHAAPDAGEKPPEADATAVAEAGVFRRPQSVLVVICTRGGEFLLLRRTDPKAFWQSVTGSLARGESPRSAALREVREETGLDAGSGLVDLKRSVLFPILKSWRGRYAPNCRFNREYWFALVLETRRLIRRNPGEHSQYRWLSAEAAARLATSWTNQAAIRLVAGIP